MERIQIEGLSPACINAIWEIVSDGIWDWNIRTGQVNRNPGWYRMLGYENNSLQNTVLTWERLIHKDDYDRVMEQFDNFINNPEGSYFTEYRCLTQAGSYLWIEDSARIVEANDKGEALRVIGAHRNIDAEVRLRKAHEFKNDSLQNIIDLRTKELQGLNKRLEEKIAEAQYLATTDSLTAIANRYYFEEKLALECARAKRFREPLSLLAIDIDHFKEINDQHGHATGDKVLVTVASVIYRNIREIDIVARWGGDELMVLLPNTPEDEAFIVADKLRLLIGTHFDIKSLKVTASFGVAAMLSDEDPMRLTIRADNALYSAKREGRNTVILAHG